MSLWLLPFLVFLVATISEDNGKAKKFINCGFITSHVFSLFHILFVYLTIVPISWYLLIVVIVAFIVAAAGSQHQCFACVLAATSCCKSKYVNFIAKFKLSGRRRFGDPKKNDWRTSNEFVRYIYACTWEYTREWQ